MHKLNPMGLKTKMTMAQLVEDDQLAQQKNNKAGGSSSSPNTKNGSTLGGWVLANQIGPPPDQYLLALIKI